MLTWTNDLMVSVPKVDEQHQKLVELVNSLYNAMKTGKGKEVSGKILKELIDYTSYHFSTEEEYMRQYSYPDMENHIQEHKKLVASVLDFKKRYDNNEIAITVDLFKFLNNWLVDHILGADKKMGNFLKTRIK